MCDRGAVCTAVGLCCGFARHGLVCAPDFRGFGSGLAYVGVRDESCRCALGCNRYTCMHAPYAALMWVSCHPTLAG